jgi:hypothetical protein
MKRWILASLGLSVVWFSIGIAQINPTDRGREVEIIIDVIDPGSRSIPGATLHYEQVSQDFMFSTGWRWRGDRVSPQLLDRFNEIGFNTGHLLLFYMWEGAEPSEGVFNWAEIDHAVETFGTTLPQEELPHLQHHYVVLGPAFGQLSAAPDWVDTKDLSVFQEQYGAFLQNFLERYRDRLEIYAVLHELEGTASGLSKDETLDWIEWQTHLTRETDPGAIILVQTGDTHWYFPDKDEIDIGEAIAMPKVELMEWLIENGIDFDGFAVETHYSMAAPGDWHQMEEAIRSLTSFGKFVYIWESYYPSRYDPCLYFNWMDRALTSKTVPAEWPFAPDTYSEEWQEEQVTQSMNALMANPNVLGWNYGTLAGADFVDGFSDSPGFGFGQNLCDQRVETNLGLIHMDFTPKPAYIALRDYWISLFSTGELKTNEEGKVEWIGMPGEYQINVRADGFAPRSMTFHAKQGHVNTFQIELQPSATRSEDLEASRTAAATMPEPGNNEEETEGGTTLGSYLFLGAALVFVFSLSLVLHRWRKRRT